MIGVNVTDRVIVAGRPVSATGSFLAAMLAVAWILVIAVVAVVLGAVWLIVKIGQWLFAWWRRRHPDPFALPPTGPRIA